MLLKLGHKAQAEIEATNRGEKRLEVTADVAEKSERQAPRGKGGKPNPNNPRSGPIDPSKLEKIPEDFFIGVVSSQDNVGEEKRSNANFSHVSDLVKGGCVRKTRLKDESGEVEYENVTGGHRVMWKIGKAVEKHIRDSYIKAIKGKGVLGKWSCKCGGTEYEGIHNPKAKACVFCRTAPTEYNEITLFDHEAGICGNPDILVFIGVDNKLYIIEIKSMNGEDFDELTRAMPDHVYQAASYRRMAIKAGYDVADELILVYCTKKFKFGKPYKQFNVDARQEYIENILDGMWESGKALAEARRKGTLPPRTKCSSASCSDAKKCSKVVDCFQRG